MGAALGKLCSASRVPAVGSVLDRVISQPSSEDHTVLYKLADYKKGRYENEYDYALCNAWFSKTTRDT